ncbi:Hypothetical protein CINCED_3A020133 [Cinara cedri]|uniref:CUE domain-containing protein n=1 Tax=Cinara cedri TaxID=506608 RepID=A0A5E4MK27_9HEMI|nr:Hypothetical protein CINCED_3A020133 [Cinara cedri]
MVDVPVDDMIKNTFAWHNKNSYKSGKPYNLFNYFTNNEESHTKYRHYQMTVPLSVQTLHDSPCKNESSQPFYHIHQDSMTIQNSSPTPVRFSPRMGSNAINYARSTATNRVLINPNMSPMSSYNVNQSISKINSMFPTASESHIRALLNKYHNREAVVISALQVEKHPITTPGPYTPPSVSRHYIQANPSPAGSPLPKSAHYSPKMKLRYLKSVFPVVEETVLLDTLCSADNNVNQATETLLTMGFNKRNNISNIVPNLPRVTLTNNKNDYDEDDIFWIRKKKCDNYDKTKSVCSSWPISPDATSTLNNKTNSDEQIKIKQRLHKKFNDQEEKIITFALESTSYNEVLADQILKNYLDNEFKTKDENDW